MKQIWRRDPVAEESPSLGAMGSAGNTRQPIDADAGQMEAQEDSMTRLTSIEIQGANPCEEYVLYTSPRNRCKV